MKLGTQSRHNLAAQPPSAGKLSAGKRDQSEVGGWVRAGRLPRHGVYPWGRRPVAAAGSLLSNSSNCAGLQYCTPRVYFESMPCVMSDVRGIDGGRVEFKCQLSR